MNTAVSRQTPIESIAARPVMYKNLLRRLSSMFSHNKAGLLGLAIVVALAVLALLAPVLPLHDPTEIFLDHRLEAPSAEFLLGTDQAGRDLLSRIIWGGRVSLVIGVSVVAIGLLIGIAVGLVAGYYSGSWLDEALMKSMEILASIPLLIWAIAMVGVLGVGPTTLAGVELSNEQKLVILIGLLYAPGLARLTYTMAQSEARAEYVLARKLQGAGDLEIMFGDVLPNCLSPILVQATLLLGVAIIVEASLSFIGLGVQPPSASWGIMLSDAKNVIFSGEWWVAVFPGMAIFLAVLGFNLVGDALRTMLDPRRSSATIKAKDRT